MSPQPPPLVGVRVLDLSRVLAGPYCTMLLGDMGADVVKVESPGSGDDTRAWGPPFAGGESAYYLALNRNKRSITLNLRDPRATAVVRELARSADMLVENFKLGSMERWGLGFEQLRAENQGLIYVSISGYGPSGPMAGRPGYDFLAQAEGGWMSITGEPDGEPMKVGVALVDVITGLFAASAALAALHGRGRDGEGQRVDVSLFESAIASLVNVASNYLISGERPGRFGNAHPNVVPYQLFATEDGLIALGVGNDRQYARFCELAGVAELAREPYGSNAGRVANREKLVAALRPILAARPTADWLRLLGAEGIPCGVVQAVDEVLEHPQTRAREMVQLVPHPTAGLLRLVGLPYKLSGTPLRIHRHPPLLGEHTDEVLKELGRSPEEIALLREEGVI